MSIGGTTIRLFSYAGGLSTRTCTSTWLISFYQPKRFEFMHVPANRLLVPYLHLSTPTSLVLAPVPVPAPIPCFGGMKYLAGRAHVHLFQPVSILRFCAFA